MRRIALLFYRLGPYHLARLRVAARDHDVTAIEYAQVDKIYDWEVVPGAEGFRRVTLFQNDMFEKMRAERIQAQIDNALAGSGPEAVAIPGWGDRCSLSALRWCLRLGVPAVVMSETTAWDDARLRPKEWVKGRVVSAFSAGLVGGTPHRDYLASLGMPADRVFMGYDAVDNAYFAGKAETLKAEKLKSEGQGTVDGGRKPEDGSQRSDVRKKHGLPERYFLASARFIEKKNLGRLLEAYAVYREKAGTLKAEKLKPEGQRTESARGKAESREQKAVSSPVVSGPVVSGPVVSRPVVSSSGGPVVPWSLVLLGDGPLRDTLNSQLSTLNLQDHVLMPGFKQYPDLPAYYGLASAFIQASTTEQWGLVVNEAMASGLPVLVSNRCGCAPDLVQEGVNGFTFDPYNAEELAQLMLKMSAFQPLSLSTFGEASRRIISDWGPERFASGLKAAVAKALEVGPVRPTLLQQMTLKALLWR